MGTTFGSFADIIGEDRKARQEHSWTGSFLDYLELVRQDASIPKFAHARLYEAVTRAADGAPRTFILPDLPPADAVPDEAELKGLGFGSSPPLDEAATGRGVPVVASRNAWRISGWICSSVSILA